MFVLFLCTLIIGMVLIDVTVVLALFNMVGWVFVYSHHLLWLLFLSIAALVVGSFGLSWIDPNAKKGQK